jgi:DNA-binding NarL/FixJ family response regulator
MNTALILDDVAEAKIWLSAALTVAFPSIKLHFVSSLAEAYTWLELHPAPQIALIDLGLPDGSGIQLISKLNMISPSTMCVVASIFDDDQHLFPALRAGATGYLLKDQSQAEIIELLCGIVEGRPPLSPAIARKMLRYFKYIEPHQEDLLTDRQTEVLCCIAKGMTLNKTAIYLSLSPHTISDHVKAIYRKLNVSSRAQAALSAHQMGLI